LDKILAHQMKTSQQNIVDLYVGRRLKLLRNQKYISQKELAGRLGVTFQQIQKYEKGLNRLPASRMLAICFSLDITPNDLFRDLLSKEYPPKESVTYTDQEMELIETLRQLAPPLKSQVRKIVGTLASQ
jgi:transcriptional regulator with XRE-family HTH domain